MSIEGLEERVIKWAEKRDLYAQSTDATRLRKVDEEMREFIEACFGGDIEDIKLEAGDVQVTAINWLHPQGCSCVEFLKNPSICANKAVALFIYQTLQFIQNKVAAHGLNMEACLSAAYQKIKDRDGKMVGGTYVKSEDLE